jgi:hypothetical protein
MPHKTVLDDSANLPGARSPFSFPRCSLRISRFSRPPLLSLTLFFIISSALSSTIPETRAATYHVDATSGNDTNNGLSPDTPWKTIAKVNSSAFNPGDQILFRRGETWREKLVVSSSGISNSPIVVSAYGSGNKPTIVGSDAITIWTNIGGNVWDATVTTQPSVVWFTGTSGMKEAAKSNLNASSEWSWTSNVLSVYSATSPTNVEAASRGSTIIASGHSYLKLSNFNLIRSGNVNSGANCQLGSGSSDIEVDACDFAQADTCHIGIWGTARGSFTVSGCTFAYSGLGHYVGAGNGIDVTRTTEGSRLLVTVQRCTFTHIGDWRGSQYHDHGIYFKSGRLIWRYNCVNNGGVETGAGVKISGNAQDGCEVYYSMFSKGRGTQSWGVLSEAGCSHKIYNNVFYGVGTGVWQAGPHGPTVAGGSGITVRNNIFHTTGYRFLLASTVHGTHGTVTTNFVSDHNLFFGGSATPLQWGPNAYSFADWKVNTRQDADSKTNDPEFMDPSQDDFTLQPSSPCIDAGADVGLKQDFRGTFVPQRVRVDIGALEARVSSSTNRSR